MSRSRALMVFIALTDLLQLSAQLEVPTVEWETIVGGQRGNSVRETSDGGFALTGLTGGDVFLAKVDSRGEILWRRAIDVLRSDGGYDLETNEAGDLIVTGWTASEGPCGLDFCGAGVLSDVLLLKTDADGSVLWERVFGGDRDDAGRNVIATRDGGFLITGHTLSGSAIGRDYYLVKTNAQGELEWERNYGGDEEDGSTGDLAHATVEAINGGFAVVGTSGGSGSLLMKINPRGQLEWKRTFPLNLLREIELLGNGYVLAGLDFTSGEFRGSLIATDGHGAVLWRRLSRKRSAFRAIHHTHDGGFILAGGCTEVDDLGNVSDRACLVRTDGDGNFLWEGVLPGNKIAFSVRQAEDGGYIVGGDMAIDFVRQDAFLAKLSPETDRLLGFVRGEINGDAVIDLADGVAILNFLFLGGPRPPCLDAADTDDSGSVGITDAILLFSHLFLSGVPLAPPHPDPGPDPTDDGLVCRFELRPLSE